MDAMALLCTLHADGPATLKSLRAAGCASLESVETMAEERLARLLGSPPAAARRFAREARHLRERMGQGLLEREESPETGLPPPVSGEALAPVSGEELIGMRAEPLEAPAVDVVEAALAEWRTRDLAELSLEEHAEEQPEEESEPDDLLPRPARARPEFEFGTALTAAMQKISSVEAEAPAPPAGLAPGAVDGLGEDLCRALEAAQILTLEELSLCDPLDLSRECGLGYTRMWRLIGLARRALSEERPTVLVEVPAAAHEVPPAAAERPMRISRSEAPPPSGPSILELEWNREIRPTAPPPGRILPEVTTPDALRESAGGPFA